MRSSKEIPVSAPGAGPSKAEGPEIVREGGRREAASGSVRGYFPVIPAAGGLSPPTSALRKVALKTPPSTAVVPEAKAAAPAAATTSLKTSAVMKQERNAAMLKAAKVRSRTAAVARYGHRSIITCVSTAIEQDGLWILTSSDPAFVVVQAAGAGGKTADRSVGAVEAAQDVHIAPKHLTLQDNVADFLAEYLPLLLGSCPFKQPGEPSAFRCFSVASRHFLPKSSSPPLATHPLLTPFPSRCRRQCLHVRPNLGATVSALVCSQGCGA